MTENSSESSASAWKTVVGNRVILVESANPWYESVEQKNCTKTVNNKPPPQKQNNFKRILCFLMLTIMLLILLQISIY